MSTILEHFKPPPLASDPPAKTRYWPAPPTPSSGGILQRPQIATHTSASSSSSQLSGPSESVLTPSTRVSFAPLPDTAERKRRNSITLGVAARSAALRQIKERNAGAPQAQTGPRPSGSGAPRRPQYMYAGQPRPRRPAYKDDDVVDLGEVAMDAGKKLWRVINKKSRKSGAASDSGRPESVGDGALVVGGPTVGVSGHNTEREILVRGFAVPEDIPDEEEEEEERERDEEEEREHVHRTEDYVADMQALRIQEDLAEPGETFAVDPSAVSSTATKGAESIEPGHIHSTRRSPPPRHSPLNATPESEASELFTSDSSSALSGIATPNADPHRTNQHLDSSSEKNSLF
ncbi:Daxx domain protein [Ceratobasidium sp. AG-Ba]|nr:Daxx domain protein [Ceratobasidium sp. AG-Ba]QRW01826.1 Daxx domain protein [Ceratobasidium sp. AG-Ba]